MRQTAIVFLCILVAVMILSACGAQEPSPTPPTASPSPEPTQPATSRPRPTATPYAPPTAEPGVFRDSEYGVSLRYPRGWIVSPSEEDPTILTWFVYREGNVIAALIAGPAPAGQTLESTAAEIHESVLSEMVDLTVISDEGTTLGDGREAWTTLATGLLAEDDVELKMRLTTTTNDGTAFVMFVFAPPDNYDAYEEEVDDLVEALRFETPSLYGIPRDEALVLVGGESTNPREYDPATTHGSGNKMVFSGLVSFDPQLNLLPELAESWEVTEGTVYTFRLRENARFHDGRPVTAEDVIYSWERAADPATDSDTVLTYLGDIVGVKEMKEGRADHISGLEALDTHTLQVTIDAPKPYFLLKLTYPTAFVLDRANVESGPEWYRMPNGTGPYRLIRWDSFEVTIYERYEDFYLGSPAIPYVVVKIYSGVGIRLYETGQIDVTGVSRYDVPRVLDPNDPLHADVLSSVNLCTSYVVFDIDQPPFDDPLVRKAFVLAFDRERYIDIVLRDVGLPARGVYPPALPGYNADLEGFDHDPERAQELLTRSTYGGPEELPPIIFTDSGLGSDTGGDVAALAQMWQQTLGVTITIENIDPNIYWDEINAGRHGQLFSAGWCADYPDPENFADTLFHSESQQNRGHYNNPAVDMLLEQARVEQDVSTRLRLYQEIEQLIVEDAPALFTTHSLSYVLVKPYVQGYVLTAVDVPLERYLRLDYGQ